VIWGLAGLYIVDIVKFLSNLLNSSFPFFLPVANALCSIKNFSILHLENSIELSPVNDLLNVNPVFRKDKEEMGIIAKRQKEGC